MPSHYFRPRTPHIQPPQTPHTFAPKILHPTVIPHPPQRVLPSPLTQHSQPPPTPNNQLELPYSPTHLSPPTTPTTPRQLSTPAPQCRNNPTPCAHRAAPLPSKRTQGGRWWTAPAHLCSTHACCCPRCLCWGGATSATSAAPGRGGQSDGWGDS